MIDATHRNTALLVAGCFFMEMLDGTIVTTAAPQIGQSLHAPPAAVGLVVTAYLVTLAAVIPLAGWLTRRYGQPGDLHGRDRGVHPRLGGLRGEHEPGDARRRCGSLQGAGGAMMVPVGRAMVVSPAAKRDLLRITSYVVWPA